MWVVFALGSAVFQVLRNMAMKRLGHSLDDTINVWGRFTFLLPYMAVAVAWRGIPPLQAGIWWWCLAFGVCQTLATLSLSRALKLFDFSLVTSLWKLSLLMLVGWGFLTLGETPTPLGLAGILVSVAGVYFLNVSHLRISWRAPLLALFQDRGQLFTLGSAFFYAPSVVIIKQISLMSDPYFATLMSYVFASSIVTPYAIYRSRHQFRHVARYWLDFTGMGLFAALTTLFGAIAYTMTLTSYAEAVKQVEILLALAIGYTVFHERARVRAIWPACLVMLVGLVMVKLWG